MTTAVLVSGGLDSYIAWRMAPEDKKAVWVDLGQPYALKEQQAIVNLGIPAAFVHIKNFYPNPITIDNSEIPGRNLLLSLAAAQHGDVVWLSALEGEMHMWTRDKTPEFFHMTSALLTFILSNIHKETIVTTPFKGMTKTDIVRHARLVLNIPEEELKLTSSCYHETLKNCGFCGTCFKRWIAMINNGIEEKYENNPWESPYAKRTFKEIMEALRKEDFSHYSFKRIQETVKAMDRAGL